MVYTGARTVAKHVEAQLSTANCTECSWSADDPLTVRGDAVEHVKNTTHKVRVEVKQLSRYELEGKGY